ncbi:NADPH:quinone reductase-like Zn-dependent oxidoreductase [Kribbella orskensis]|uniref:enoyl-[acyl-carrier-protein] reductase n=1 Tax=Kribbella orskensis TaxID=2512216 RepID=A0ABY2BFT4_9ACTN|nr:MULTISPECIES: zinc-dependent alcohol dehydrogenase family protein [Kribbella]TCN37557.1 NADPH:quinone reductase-like Zn-dependent oxidoreductase [Kribbella sp. VKM Ac-2500]TCO18941.1 NADPH:quinone reductase-like Zn-dependent oxidoreductase [Kribbella orskensis]
MSQLILNAIGDIDESVALVTDPDLTVGPDDVLVGIEAAAINPVDFMLASGTYGYQAQAPFALGSEGVGRVVQAGTSVDQSLVGRRVLIVPNYQQGAWADQVVVASRNIVPLPDEGDPAQLAMVGINPLTAYLALNRYVDLRPGQWVGQNLGNSGVGQYVIALAKKAGLKTLSVVRREEVAERLRAAGADLVVVDGNDLAGRIAEALGEEKLSLVLDGTGDATAGALAQSLEFEGTVVSYSSVTGAPTAIGLGDSIYRQLSLRGLWIVNWLNNASREELEQTYTELAALVADGVLRAEVEATYPLAEFRKALDHARQGGRSGKILFRP